MKRYYQSMLEKPLSRNISLQMQQMLLDKKSPEKNKAHVNKKKWAHLEV